jgi:hypothetical protein
MSSASEPIAVAVDGQDFLMRARADEAGVYDFEWLTGPRRYGFTVGRSDRSTMSRREADEAIRSFLAQVDPSTGHID